ncbi:hypothetical protein ACFW04_014061 [Cataglyphis niger]
MYLARGNHMNYYIPIQDNETSSCKKKKYNNISFKPRAVHILERRYSLTLTSYKYLEIGISAKVVWNWFLVIIRAIK